MSVNVTLLVAVKEPLPEQSQPGLPAAEVPDDLPRSEPWLAAGWPPLFPLASQPISESRSGYELLWRLIAGPAVKADDKPPHVAELTAALDGLPSNRHRWRADPVHLLPDRDQLVVIPGKLANLSQVEAERIVELLNDYFQDDFTLEIGTTHRWYLTPSQPLAIKTHSLDAAAGGSARVYQAQGDDAMALQRWLNEIQMALHAAIDNGLGEAQQPTAELSLVNSLWVWGQEVIGDDEAGDPTARLNAQESVVPPVDQVLADAAWATALADHYQVAVRPLPRPTELADLLPASGHLLVDLAQVDGSYQPDDAQVQAWCEQLGSLMGKQINQVSIYAIDRDGWQLRQWRRRDFHFLRRWWAKLRQSRNADQP